MATPIPLNAEAAESLALAMVAASASPLLLLAADLTVIAASASFVRAFLNGAANPQGRPLYKLGAGEWDTPQLRALMSATASGAAEVEAYEMELRRGRNPARQLLLRARRLVYGDASNVRILLTVSDVTEARRSAALVDDMRRENAVLVQEVQHRVANSLQIIASLLMLSARRVQSDETRSQLRDAHNRVMSVAAVQKQLAASADGDVELAPYFTNLCEGLAASMIADPDQVSLTVTSDDSVASPDVSTSLGLIVTELVINALKHAFPEHRSGAIGVDYRRRADGWTLSVSDDGVGMRPGSDDATPGLGTSIVAALAKHLNARVKVADLHPGTAVSISHDGRRPWR